MYKNKEAQKAANKAAKARWKQKQGIPAGIPEQGIPGYSAEGIPPRVFQPRSRMLPATSILLTMRAEGRTGSNCETGAIARAVSIRGAWAHWPQPMAYCTAGTTSRSTLPDTWAVVRQRPASY